MAKNNIITVKLWGTEVGRIGLDEARGTSAFQFSKDFLNLEERKQVFPNTGVIRRIAQPQVFSQSRYAAFSGLPSPIADSLPDMFGNLIFKRWLEANGRDKITVLEQLAYVANRGMGALEYEPAKPISHVETIDLEQVIQVMKQVLDTKSNAQQPSLNSEALVNIFKIGTSAGGARPKVLISEHKKTGAIIPGDLAYSSDYDHYLIKLSSEDDGFGSYPRELVEYCYYLTAKAVGIRMMDSKLVDDKHFATLRFDRQGGEKQHVLTVSGMTGWYFKSERNSSYENLFSLALFLKLPHSQIEELFRRMVFNVIFQNTDDHLENHAFIYDKSKDRWNLAPAYDLTYALNPLLNATDRNRALSLNGKRVNVDLQDVLIIADNFTIKHPKRVIEEVQSGISLLQQYMTDYNVPEAIKVGIMKQLTPLL